MVRNALIGVVVAFACAGAAPAYAWHPTEQPPAGMTPADRIGFPSFSSSFGGQPAMSVAEPGDVNGDGRDDLAVTFPGWYEGWGTSYVVFTRPAGRGGSEPVEERPGFRIVGGGGSVGIASAGDLNEDGLDDLAVLGGNPGLRVVFGKRDSETVYLSSARTLQIDGPWSSYWAGSSNGVMRPPPIINAGDQNGDGRTDLAIAAGGQVSIIYTPADPEGAWVDTNTIEEHEGVALRTNEDVRDIDLASLGDVWGDRRDELLVGWSRSADDLVRLVGAGLTGGAGDVDLLEVAESGRGWERHEEGWFNALTTLRPAVAGDRRRPIVGMSSRTVLIPDTGPQRVEQSISSGAEVMESHSSLIVDVGDQDRDGRADIGVGEGIRYLDGQRTYPFSGVMFPYENEVWSQVVASLGDLDGDGFREVVVARVDHDNTYDGAPENAARWRLDVYHSRSWPHDHDRSRVAWNPQPQTGGCCWGRPYGGPPPPSGARPTPPRGTSRRDAFDISETPVYLRGGVDVALRSARGSTAVAKATVAGWRPGSPGWELPEATARSASNPWVKLAFALPPPARQALEADGRLRMNVALTLKSSSGRVSEESVRMVVVTRPRPGAFGAQRRLRGSFGAQRLLGGPLADLITGASADDVLRGGDGSDALHGGTGDDTLYGEGGNDLLDGDDGDDRLDGGPGNDQVVELRFGDDHLAGGEGDDFVSGGRGEDTVSGGPGDDILAGGSGPDEVSCGDGEDIVFVNFSAERSRLKGCEHVYDEPGVLHAPCTDGGTPSAETLLGTEGDDYCVAGDGGDDLEGRGGDDVLVGQGGNDRLFGRFGRDTLDGGEGDDELEGGRGQDLLRGGPGNDRLNGGYDDDRVAGGAGNDRIVARGGGVDQVTCGPGIDTVYADSRDRLTGCERVRRSGRRSR